MKIETKYDIGQRIWIVYEHKGEAHIYEDEIAEICFAKDEILYFLKKGCDEVEEKDIILYEDTESLINKIKEIMKEIKGKEGKENEKF